MSASLVGSEMCIRDRPKRGFWFTSRHGAEVRGCALPVHSSTALEGTSACLLYTSDAADDM
eukprot:15075162-Alexandrium_andersonii.AAC.1